MKNVLIVDSDLQFVCWLCHVLDAAGYETVPATGIPEAIAALGELDLSVDLLMVCPGLPGARAFANELRSSQRDRLKAIALIDQNEMQCESAAPWDGWQVKLSISDAVTREVFLSLAQSILADSAAIAFGGANVSPRFAVKTSAI